jgi:amino acid transporter
VHTFSAYGIQKTQFSGWSVFLHGQWNTATFITSYFPVVMFPILYIAARLWTRVPHVKVSQMDFYTGLAEIEAITYDEPPPRNRLEAFWQWLVSDRVQATVSIIYSCLLRRCEWGIPENEFK